MSRGGQDPSSPTHHHAYTSWVKMAHYGSPPITGHPTKWISSNGNSGLGYSNLHYLPHNSGQGWVGDWSVPSHA